MGCLIVTGKLSCKARRGFTLIELMVVMAIIALLLTLALPKYFHSLDRSREAVLQENLRTTRDALDKFYADRGKYPDTLEQLVSDGYLRRLPYDPVADSDRQWLIVPPDNAAMGGVFDLHSSAEGTGADGSAYSSW